MPNKTNEIKNFAKDVITQIKDYLPDEYKSVDCIISEVPKNNGIIKTGITFQMSGSNICPTIYMEEYYKLMKDGKDIRSILQDISQNYVHSILKPLNFDAESFLNLENVKEKIFPILINGKANEQFLSGVPHRMIADLALIYEIELEDFIMGFVGSIKIKNKLLSKWEISEEDLYRIAANNMITRKEPSLYILNEITDGNAQEAEWQNLLCTGSKKTDKALLLTTKQIINGAALLAIPEIMTKIGAFFPNGCYIVPSSINEVILQPKNEEKKYDYFNLINEVNSYILERKNFLSNNLYEFNPENGCIDVVNV